MPLADNSISPFHQPVAESNAFWLTCNSPVTESRTTLANNSFPAVSTNHQPGFLPRDAHPRILGGLRDPPDRNLQRYFESECGTSVLLLTGRAGIWASPRKVPVHPRTLLSAVWRGQGPGLVRRGVCKGFHWFLLAGINGELLFVIGLQPARLDEVYVRG